MAKKQTAVNDAGLRRLKEDLKNGTPARLYFFYGEERYLQEHYLNTLIKKTVAGPMEEFNYRRLTDESMSLEALMDAVDAMPMMADYVLVQVDDYNPYAQDADTRQALISLFSDLPDTCCLVFHFDTVKFSYGAEKDDGDEGPKEKKGDKTKKLLKECIEEYGVQVEFYKQSPAELAEWVTRHFRALEKAIAPDLCQYLVFITGGSMTTLYSEIGKIAAYCSGTTITRQDIDAVTEPVLQAAMFDITDAIAENNYDKALLKLHEVLKTKESPIVVLGTVGSHFRRLLAAKTAAAAGKGADVLMEVFGSNSEFYCRKMMTQAARLSEAFCLRAVQLCYDADCSLKRSYGDGEDVAELLLLTLAQEGKQ